MKPKLALAIILITAAPLFAQMPEYKGTYRDLAESKKHTALPPLATADSIHSYDALAYTFDLALALNSLSGKVAIRFKAVDNNLAMLPLHFEGMTVDSVRQSGVVRTFSRVGGMLNINLLAPLPSGDSAVVEVFYHGLPSLGLYFHTNSFSQPVWYSFTEPSDARYWFPCWDEPWDKAYCDMTVNAPSAMKVTGNGHIESVTDGPGPGKRTWRWIEDYPIATYLVSLAACDYAVLQDSVDIGGEYLPLINYVYHADSSDAAYDFANVGAMVTFFSAKFGTYPFMGEKYSMSATRIFSGWGAMEHQTNTTFGDRLITGSRYYEWIVAHELAHMWFGDKTTCVDWRNIWLNEGFASYLDALFTEHFYGQSAFQNRMAGFRNEFFNEDNSIRYPIYDPPPAYLFGSAEYEKGAWVLHMMRGLMGDSSFFAGMYAYSDSFAYGNSSTDDFQGVMEQRYGNSLDWFFDEWIYDQGYPVYQFGWATQPYEGQTNFLFQIRQVQSNAPIFTMPIKIWFQGPGFDTTITFWNNQADQYYSIMFPGAPSVITFDPGEWILKSWSTISFTPKPDIVLSTSEIGFSLIRGEVDTVSLPLGNAGNANLNYSILADTTLIAALPSSGSVAPGEVSILNLIVAGDSEIDSTFTISVSSNDPDEAHLNIPVHILVTGSPVIPGDANGSGEVNGIDVVFLVNYLKGLGPAPDPYLNGDSNGNCDVNGLDVVFLVNYLKGIGGPPFAGECR